MYKVSALLTKNPVTLAGAVIAVVNFFIIRGWLDWDGKSVAALNIALVSVLGLFVANTVSSNQKLAELDEATPRKARAAKKT